MADESEDPLRDAAPAYDDLEAKRARAGVAAALFGGLGDEGEDEQDARRLTVGRYEIDSRLGAGGMGVVYRAHDPDLDRPVAVKLLHADSSADDKARARMLREARSLAKLSHPNVITVYDVGTEDGQVFVAMELVAGPDLRRWLEGQTPAQWRETLALFIAAGRGLEAAHGVALIHRDFKPENVLVGDDGRVRVLDFGLARMHEVVEGPTADRGAPSPSAVRTDGDGDEANGDLAHLPTSAFNKGLTETGALLGTPLYMAPELYAGRGADARSDQFAFCASLYEGVYRELPFGARDLSKHVKAVTAGQLVAPAPDTPVPASLRRVIARGLDPDPDARHRDMAALLDALEAVLAEPAQTELPAAGGLGRWIAVAAVVVAAVFGLVGLELGWFGGGEVGAPGAVELAGATGVADATELAGATGVVGATGVASVAAGPQDSAASETGARDDGASDEGTDATTGTVEEHESTSETGLGEDVAEGDESPASAELDGWCHLHEDRYTLLSRTKSRRASFEHQGRCYTCRVERRRSRTRNFSPRDCAGYSLCGEASADACG